MKRLVFWVVMTIFYVTAVAAVATIPAAGEGFLGIVSWFFLGYIAFILIPQIYSAIQGLAINSREVPEQVREPEEIG
jgi:hypothetical protein